MCYESPEDRYNVGRNGYVIVNKYSGLYVCMAFKRESSISSAPRSILESFHSLSVVTFTMLNSFTTFNLKMRFFYVSVSEE